MHGLLRLALLGAAASARGAAAQQVVAPGGVTPYAGGGGGGRQFGGYVRLNQPVLGFFVAGSSIDALNGCYGPRLQDTSSLPEALARDVRIGAYRHQSSGWLLAHVQTDGVRGGDEIPVGLPDGRAVLVAVPVGLSPGDEFIAFIPN